MDDPEAQGLRQRISEFLDEKLETKIKNLKDDDPDRPSKEQKLRDEHQRETWIADAARRANEGGDSRLQLVTHPAKATHPFSKATSLYIPPPELPNHGVVGSHILGKGFVNDVTSNASKLDIFKFLKLEYEGRSLLSRVMREEPALARAFSDDPDQGMEWVQSFAGISQPSGAIKADPRTRQVYWLVGEEPARDTDFHLLAPLFSSVLAQRIHSSINDTRFGDESKATRQAFWSGKFSEREHREYLGLAEQRLGGANPQNVSQLNTERGGSTYLLASLPPNWHSTEVRPLHHTESALQVFGRRKVVRQTLQELERFLETEPRPNKATREHRDALVSTLVDELLLFAAELQELEPGWSADPACQLPEEEALWLDPERAEADPDFAQRRATTEWESEVCDRFASWLNHRLRQKLPVGDTEHSYWEDQLRQETTALQEVLAHA